jgi:hypothetical protein
MAQPYELPSRLADSGMLQCCSHSLALAPPAHAIGAELGVSTCSWTAREAATTSGSMAASATDQPKPTAAGQVSVQLARMSRCIHPVQPQSSPHVSYLQAFVYRLRARVHWMQHVIAS